MKLVLLFNGALCRPNNHQLHNWYRGKTFGSCRPSLFWNNNRWRQQHFRYDRTESKTSSTVKAGFHMIADRRSQIADRNNVCDRLRSYGNQPLDWTWFYLLRSSAIAIAGSQTIAEVVSIWSQTIADDRRPYCDLRSAIRDHMETRLKKSCT